jgi:hypothetical protein
LMDTELIPGKKMRRFMKETSKMDWGMVRENGHPVKQNIQVIIQKDSNKVSVNCIFRVAIFIRVIS